jgi:hypothetical protein
MGLLVLWMWFSLQMLQREGTGGQSAGAGGWTDVTPGGLFHARL